MARTLLLRAIAAHLGAAVLAILPHASAAQTGNVTRIIVGYPPGQTVDAIARSYAAALATELQATVIVENRPGANGIIAASEVKRAPPDGKTLLFGTSGQLAINPFLYKKLPYEAKDFAPVALLTSGAMLLIATPSFPPNNLSDLIAYAKARPGQLNYGSGGQGITGHLGMELLQDAVGIKLVHVPYKGSPAALTDVMSGQISLMMESSTAAIPHVRSGRVKALGVTSAKRISAFAEIPTIAEQGVKAFEVTAWAAVVAPTGTPDAVVADLNTAIQRASKNPIVVETLKSAGADSVVGTPQQLSAFWQSELQAWAKAVARSGVQLDN